MSNLPRLGETHGQWDGFGGAALVRATGPVLVLDPTADWADPEALTIDAGKKIASNGPKTKRAVRPRPFLIVRAGAVLTGYFGTDSAIFTSGDSSDKTP